jgi:hypothetical protein
MTFKRKPEQGFSMSKGKELETPASSAQDSIPEAVSAIMALFDGRLKGVAFPGIDGVALSERVKEVESAHQALADFLASADSLRQELAQAKDRLVKDAERALAYARVYAGDDSELHESLAQIEFASPDSERRRKPRRAAGDEAGGDEPRAPKRRAKGDKAEKSEAQAAE